MPLKLTAGYRLDFQQLSRIAWFCSNPTTHSLGGSRIAEDLGISYARLQRLWMVANALGMGVRGRWHTSDLGRLVLQHDRFFDDLGTLWLLHYIISSNPEQVVWSTMANRVVPENRRITIDISKSYFADVLQGFSQESFEKHLNKEISSYLDAYVRQHFSELAYISEESPRTYIQGNPKPVPPQIFHAAVLSYRDRFVPRAATLDVPILAKAANSPGRVFGLTERQVRDLLEEAKRLGYLYVETRADLDQVRFRDDFDFLGAVRRYYEER